MEALRLDGLVVAAVTPMTESGEVNFDFRLFVNPITLTVQTDYTDGVGRLHLLCSLNTPRYLECSKGSLQIIT